MTKADDVVRPLTTVQDAAKRMKALQTTLLPVATDIGLIGMLTAEDIALRVAAEGRDPGRTHVEDVMSLGILSCFDDQEVEDALATMARKHVSRLAVLNRNRDLVGQFSVEDAFLQGGTYRLLEETRESGSAI